MVRVATASSEESLLELAAVLTASQLERALRAFTRLTAEEARRAHELEYVSYYFEEDGSLFLRARLPAEDGTLLVKALDAARERVFERRRAGRDDTPLATDGDDVLEREPERSVQVEALVAVAQASLAATCEGEDERARLVVHVDAAALGADGAGRCELAEGPVIAPETARRLGCDADLVARIEHDGLPVSVGRARRSVPAALRRLLKARDDHGCRFPGCERRRRLHAHHRRHWAQGGDTSLDNLLLLCASHHRLVHEGGYTIEDDDAGGLRFRNRHGVVTTNLPTRPPPGSTRRLLDENHARGLTIGPDTNRHGHGDPFALALAVDAIIAAAA